MKLTSISSNVGQLYKQKNNLGFNGKKAESRIIKDDDGKEYVKVPKSAYNFNQLAWGILIAGEIITVIYLLLNKKSEPGESLLKNIKNTNKTI